MHRGGSGSMQDFAFQIVPSAPDAMRGFLGCPLLAERIHRPGQSHHAVLDDNADFVRLDAGLVFEFRGHVGLNFNVGYAYWLQQP